MTNPAPSSFPGGAGLSADDARQLVALRVEADGHGILSYAFRDARGAAEMVAFLRSVMPRARFTIEPAYH